MHYSAGNYQLLEHLLTNSIRNWHQLEEKFAGEIAFLQKLNSLVSNAHSSQLQEEGIRYWRNNYEADSLLEQFLLFSQWLDASIYGNK